MRAGAARGAPRRRSAGARKRAGRGWQRRAHRRARRRASRLRRASRPHAPRAPRRECRARRGTATYVRGGSRRALRRPRALWSHAANCSWRWPRVRFGIAEYAASRISAWRKRKPSSPTNGERSGRTSSLRTSVEERRRDGCSVVGWGELEHGAAPEFLPDDCGALEHGPFERLELVEPRGEERLDRRRHRRAAVLRARRASRSSARERADCPRPGPRSRRVLPE